MQGQSPSNENFRSPVKRQLYRPKINLEISEENSSVSDSSTTTTPVKSPTRKVYTPKKSIEQKLKGVPVDGTPQHVQAKPVKPQTPYYADANGETPKRRRPRRKPNKNAQGQEVPEGTTIEASIAIEEETPATPNANAFTPGSENKKKTRRFRPKNKQKKVESKEQEDDIYEEGVEKKTRIDQEQTGLSTAEPKTPIEKLTRKPRSKSLPNKQEKNVAFMMPEKSPKIRNTPKDDGNQASYPRGQMNFGSPFAKHARPVPHVPGQVPTSNPPQANQPSTPNAEKKKKKKKKAAKTQTEQNKQTTGGPKEKKAKDRFEPYLSPEEVRQGLQNGTLYKGGIRINAHNTRESYVTAEGLSKDIYIEGFTARNRALEGDIVVVELFDQSRWKKLKITEDSDEKDIVETFFEGNGTPQVPVTPSLPQEAILKLKEATAFENVRELQEDETDDEDETSEEEDYEAEVEPHTELNLTGSQGVHDDQEEEIKVEDPFEMATPEQLSVPFKLDPQVPMTPLLSQMSKLSVDSQPHTISVSKPEELQPAGKVVAILDSKHSAEFVGHLRPIGGEEIKPDDRFAQFIPLEIRAPKMVVPIGSIPDFAKDWRTYETKLVVVKMTNWNPNNYLPLGKYNRIVGEAGEISTETAAILIQNGIDSKDFKAEVYDCCRFGYWKIPKEDLQQRRDLRTTRIFTIDPPTAKDLDDALHCTPLPDGTFEIGVHIADVSYFVKPGNPLDEEAKKRSTTVYLVQKAIPMLPHILCENLCSLNPGVDRLAFSVIWKLSATGQILNEWFGRTIIQSCSKMSYDVAQQIIEGKIKQSWSDTGVDKIYSNLGPVGGHNVNGVIQDIQNMHRIAQVLRKARFENGALSMNNVKLAFRLNEVGNPLSSYQYITREANNMVEEFMLLANQQVALKIATSFPECALLRNHIAPLNRKLESFVKFVAKNIGFNVDTSTAKSLAQSMMHLKENTSPEVFFALQLLATRSMQLAKYFCTGDLPHEEWKHYALNVNYYTHFTSPIRRYPDIIVHRLLQASLDSDVMPLEELAGELALLPDKIEMTRICANSNDKKLLARKAQEASSQLYLCVLLKNHPAVEDAVVMSVGDKYIAAILPAFGTEKKLYMEDMAIHSFENKGASLLLKWPTSPGGQTNKNSVDFIPQEVKLLSVLKVRVSTKVAKGRSDLELTLLHPREVEDLKNKPPVQANATAIPSFLEEDFEAVD